LAQLGQFNSVVGAATLNNAKQGKKFYCGNSIVYSDTPHGSDLPVQLLSFFLGSDIPNAATVDYSFRGALLYFNSLLFNLCWRLISHNLDCEDHSSFRFRLSFVTSLKRDSFRDANKKSSA